MSKFFLVVGLDLLDYQRELVHEEVKRQSSEWWHQHPDVWVTDGGSSVNWWLDRLGAIVPKAPAALIVLALPGAGGRAFTARGPRHNWAWFLKYYGTPTGGKPNPNYEIPPPPLTAPSPPGDEPS